MFIRQQQDRNDIKANMFMSSMVKFGLFCSLFRSVIAVLIESQSNGFAGPALAVPSFIEFSQSLGRTYELHSTEFYSRKSLYDARAEAATLQNSKSNRLWTAHPNGHWDRTTDELRALTGWVKTGDHIGAASSFLQMDGVDAALYRTDDLPEQHDWKDLAAMKPDRVRNQGCGNCWAVATTSMIEAHIELHTGQDLHLPDEELTECSANPFSCGGSGGCSGSTPELALKHALVNGLKNLQPAMVNSLVQTRSNRTHTSRKAFDAKADCPSTSKTSVIDLKEAAPHEVQPGVREAAPDSVSRQFGMTGWERLPENRHEPLMRALVERGPAAVAVSTDWQSMTGLSLYSSGIFDGCNSDASLSHSVLAIGYGSAKATNTDDVAKYWLLQNSWGPGFGENGHFRLLRTDNSEDHCGTDREPLIGVGCKDGASEVKVCGMCGILYDTALPHFEAKTQRSLAMMQARESRQPLQAKASFLQERFAKSDTGKHLRARVL